MLNFLQAGLRRLLTRWRVAGKRHFLEYGHDLHVGKGALIWAPQRIRIGNSVYIGKDVCLEANCEIGHHCLIANRVGIVGRHDHDFSVAGVPVRFSPWIGSRSVNPSHLAEKAVVEDDVWIGFGAIVLTGVTIGRGSIVAAGSTVTRDIPPYSIAAGSPAKVVGQRFADPAQIAAHELSIRTGRFLSSERGFDHFVIQPGPSAPSSAGHQP